MALRLVVKYPGDYYDIIFKVVKDAEDKVAICAITDFDNLKLYRYSVESFPSGFTNYTITVTRNGQNLAISWLVNGTIIRSSNFKISSNYRLCGSIYTTILE